ncbi:MAG: cadherin repeat domain-containing protein [Dehalococcoidia bacterium]|nr:cadherin repeat domain-containing protein [Dehalococcoidia bacterium]
MALTGYVLDFIALDGTVALSLDGGVDTVSGGTLSRSVASQPWQAGDQLMLRIRKGSAAPTPKPTVNTAPAFDPGSYSFSVAENAAVEAAVGTVAATDPDEGDTVTYSITAGNDTGKFAIGSSSGQVTVASTLNYESVSSYTLTVEASDGNGGKDGASVTIKVVDVVEC